MRFIHGVLVALSTVLTLGLALASFIVALIGVWDDSGNGPRWGETSTVLLVASLISGCVTVMLVVFADEITGEDQ